MDEPVAKNEDSIYYEFTEVMKGELIKQEEISCLYEVSETETLGFSVSGLEYGNVNVKLGDEVKKGEVLAELDVKDLEESIQDCNTEIESINNSIASIDRQISIEQRRIEIEKTNNKECDNSALEGLKMERSNLVDALTVTNTKKSETTVKLDKRRLVAGIDGVVTYVKETYPGDLTELNDDFIKISGKDMRFTCETEFYDHYNVGDKCEIICMGQTYNVTIAAINDIEGSDSKEMIFDMENKNYEIVNMSKGKLILELDRIDDCLYVDKTAVVNIGGKQYVYASDENGIKEAIEVTTGLETDTYIEIKSGLTEGQQIILK